MFETNLEKVAPLGGQYTYMATMPDGTRVPVADTDYNRALDLLKLQNISAVVYLEPGKFTIVFGSKK